MNELLWVVIVLLGIIMVVGLYWWASIGSAKRDWNRACAEALRSMPPPPSRECLERAIQNTPKDPPRLL